MSIEQFTALQAHLWDAYGFVFAWWLILFAVSGVIVSVLIFMLSIVRMWLDRP